MRGVVFSVMLLGLYSLLEPRRSGEIDDECLRNLGLFKWLFYDSIKEIKIY